MPLTRNGQTNDKEGGTSQAGSRVAKIEDRFLLHALEFESVLRACLYRYTRNTADVDELLQETYARLLVAGATAPPNVRSMRAFCLTVARNVALDWLRHRQIVPIELVADMEALDVLDEGAQIEEIVNAHQELSLLANAVEQLPARCRQVFTLRKVYGLSQREVAHALKMTEGNVEKHVARGMTRCIEYMKGIEQTTQSTEQARTPGKVRRSA